MNNLFIILIYGAYLRLVRADMNRSIIWSLGLAIILLTGTVATVLPIQKSYAAVTIDTSSDKFFGPALVRVLITDPAKTDDTDTINVSVDVKSGTTTVGSTSVSVDAIGTSGQFELYIAAHTNATAANPTQTNEPDANNADNNGEYSLVRINGTTTSPADNLKGIDATLDDGDKIVITYGGQTVEIAYESTTASLTVDRTTAGDQNQIVLTLTDQDANIDPTRIDEFNATATNIISPTLNTTGALFIETGQNTGIFELVVLVNNTNAPTDGASIPSPVTFPSSATFTVQDHDVYADPTTHSQYANATAPYDTIISTSSTTSRTVQLRNVDGSVTLVSPLTIGNGFMLQITDDDRNIDTTVQDTLNVTGIFGANTWVMFEETGDNTGVFLPDLTNSRIPIEIVTNNAGFDQADQVFNATATFIADDTDITITYNDPAAEPFGAESFSIQRSIQHTAGDIMTSTPSLPVTGKAIITIEDNDLDTDSTIADSHTVSFTRDTTTTPDTLVGTIANLGNITIKVIGKDITTTSLNVVFTEVDANGDPTASSGMFVGELRLEDITVTGGLEDGDKINVEYRDLTESPQVTNSIDISITQPAPSIDLDRNSYPPSHLTTSHTDNDANDVEVPIDVILHVTIEDSSANTNPTSEDTINLGKNNFMLELLDSTDFTIYPGNNTAGGNNILDASGTQFAPIPMTATETDIDSNMFELDIQLPASIGNTVIDDDYQIRVTYTSSSGDDVSDTASIASTTASLSTDANAYNLGGTIILTINEPDWNADSEEIDRLDADLSAIFVNARTDGTLEDVVTSAGGNMDLDPDQIEETGPNTGIFMIKLDNINEDFVERGSRVTFEYEDDTTTGAGGSETIQTIVNIVSGVPEIIFDKEVYTPFDEVCVTIVDSSANLDPDDKDDLFLVKAKVGSDEDVFRGAAHPNGPDTNIFKETGPNTGIFMLNEDECLVLDATAWGGGNNNNDGTLPAARDKAIRVTYETATGDIELSKSALIVFNDGSISFDKNSYKVGDTATITIIDPDLNQDPDIQDTIKIDVWSTTDRAGVEVTLRETGDKTGVFTGEVVLTSDVSSGSRLQVSEGDTITARYTDRTLPDPADYDEDTDATVTQDVARLDATATIGISKFPTERAPASEPELVDDLGNKVTDVSVGQQVLISGKVTNNQTISQNFVHIVKVTDEDGNVVMLSFTQGKLNPNEVRTNAFSWIPTEPGTYTVEVFVWESFANPMALSPKITTTVEVM